ncbi:hypothetical protein HZA40_02400 [Candidatus Peregrinibacteria bacterium]|nr:hypothetical protein [Candidatus Peregrinibacteria bacterium]
MDKKRIFTSKIICYKKDQLFLAVALNFDLISEGSSMPEALTRLDNNVKSYLVMCLEDNETDEQIYRKAPKKYFDMYELFRELDEKREDKFLGQMTFNNAQIVKHSCNLV